MRFLSLLGFSAGSKRFGWRRWRGDSGPSSARFWMWECSSLLKRVLSYVYCTWNSFVLSLFWGRVGR